MMHWLKRKGDAQYIEAIRKEEATRHIWTLSALALAVIAVPAITYYCLGVLDDAWKFLTYVDTVSYPDVTEKQLAALKLVTRTALETMIDWGFLSYGLIVGAFVGMVLRFHFRNRRVNLLLLKCHDELKALTDVS